VRCPDAQKKRAARRDAQDRHRREAAFWDVLRDLDEV